MIVWRGLGILVLVFGVIGVLFGFAPGWWLANQMYPDDPYAFNLLQALQPWIYAACVVSAGVVAGGLSWLVGSRINREESIHSLFFIPAQWFGVVYVGIALLVAGDAVMRDGVARAHDGFVSDCDKHELGGTVASCECMASKVERADSAVVVPFYAAMDKSWGSRVHADDPVGEFLDSYLPRVPQSDAAKFVEALDEGASCFEMPEQLREKASSPPEAAPSDGPPPEAVSPDTSAPVGAPPKAGPKAAPPEVPPPSAAPAAPPQPNEKT
ncbi:MAG TPA: hypothetical protein VGO52_21860 [Hyphomonadaceae bacterium]|jgi:hypothetical protein|nr:hypothetical protein [Hyphomonadaceae bacterium]